MFLDRREGKSKGEGKVEAKAGLKARARASKGTLHTYFSLLKQAPGKAPEVPIKPLGGAGSFDKENGHSKLLDDAALDASPPVEVNSAKKGLPSRPCRRTSLSSVPWLWRGCSPLQSFGPRRRHPRKLHQHSNRFSHWEVPRVLTSLPLCAVTILMLRLTSGSIVRTWQQRSRLSRKSSWTGTRKSPTHSRHLTPKSLKRSFLSCNFESLSLPLPI